MLTFWKSKLFILLSTLGLFLAGPVLAVDYDLSISQSNIEFSKSELVAGETVRIYAQVKNVGTQDITGYVTFYRNSEVIGSSQPISVRPGKTDDVFVDFTVPSEVFNIGARVQGTEPTDQNNSNDETQTALITPDIDTDGDGTVDRLDNDDDNDGLTDIEEQTKGTDPLRKDTDGDGKNDSADQFPLNSSEWQDTDGDGQGNNADNDDDNDGWSDQQEQSRGTDPLRKDTDGDGVNDPQDYYPLDGSKSVKEEERNIFQPPPEIDDETSGSQENVATQPNQPVQELPDQIETVLNNNEAAEVSQPAPVARVGEKVEKITGQNQGFFRLDNFLLWLLIAVILVGLATVWLYLKIKKNSDSGSNVSRQAKFNPPTKPVRVIKEEQPQSRINMSPNVVDLKEIMKQKQEKE